MLLVVALARKYSAEVSRGTIPALTFTVPVQFCFAMLHTVKLLRTHARLRATRLCKKCAPHFCSRFLHCVDFGPRENEEATFRCSAPSTFSEKYSFFNHHGVITDVVMAQLPRQKCAFRVYTTGPRPWFEPRRQGSVVFCLLIRFRERFMNSQRGRGRVML